MGMPRILFAAPKSGSGKTMITCGTIELLKRKGLKVASLKCGPDYIDPMFHRMVLGIPSGNIDSYFTDKNTLQFLVTEQAKKADVTIMEGVMGYYDGLGGVSTTASTYEIACLTETPVVLIVDGKGASVTLASVINGIKNFKSDSRIMGVILNRVSPGYYDRIARVIEENCGVKVIGYMPELKELQVPSRHLGLVQPEEMKEFNGWITQIADALEEGLNLDLLLEISNAASNLSPESVKVEKVVNDVRIGVARDEAFSFYYSENLSLLEKLGATIVPFSPIHDESLPTGLQGLLLGGGYPENYGRELAENKTMIQSIRASIGKIPVLAECGGFMYLQKELEAFDGNTYEMVGALSGTCQKKSRLVRFGYMEAKAKEAGWLGKEELLLKGHEFHYYDCSENGSDFCGRKPIGENTAYDCMLYKDKLLAGFPHLYYYSNIAMIKNFLFCAEKSNM